MYRHRGDTLLIVYSLQNTVYSDWRKTRLRLFTAYETSRDKPILFPRLPAWFTH